MARTINEIQEAILAEKDNAAELNALSILTQNEIDAVQPDSKSKVSEWRLWVWVVAVAIWSLEKLFDMFRKEVDEQIAATRVHTRKWYKQKALLYQHGDSLSTSDVYDNISPEKRIIQYASVRRVILSGHGALRVKVTKSGDAGAYIPLTADELSGFSRYMNLIADAGTLVMSTSTPGDKIKINIDVYYDPQLIDSAGDYIDGSGAAVLPGIDNYLKSIDFDGRLVLTELVDAIQQVRGVQWPVLKSVSVAISGGSYQHIYSLQDGIHHESYTPDSGYLEIDTDHTVINYIRINEY